MPCAFSLLPVFGDENMLGKLKKVRRRARPRGPSSSSSSEGRSALPWLPALWQGWAAWGRCDQTHEVPGPRGGSGQACQGGCYLVKADHVTGCRRGPGQKWGLSALGQEPWLQPCQMVTIGSRAWPHLPWAQQGCWETRASEHEPPARPGWPWNRRCPVPWPQLGRTVPGLSETCVRTGSTGLLVSAAAGVAGLLSEPPQRAGASERGLLFS